MLQKAGLTEEIGRIETVKDVSKVADRAREAGAKAIVVQGLPLPILAQLLTVAQKNSIQVFSFKTEALGIFNTKEDAEKNGADIVIPSREGGWRGLKTVALQLIKRVVIEAEDIATA